METKPAETKPEAKPAVAATAAEEIPLPRYPVDTIVLYKNSNVAMYAKVKNSRLMIRPNGKSDTQWQYLLDAPGVSGLVPEQFLFKVK
jgi:hypothetical protein